jgi:hypothetical protein
MKAFVERMAVGVQERVHPFIKTAWRARILRDAEEFARGSGTRGQSSLTGLSFTALFSQH